MTSVIGTSASTKHRTIEEATECMFTIGFAGSYILAVEEDGRERRLNLLEQLIFHRARRRKEWGRRRSIEVSTERF